MNKIITGEEFRQQVEEGQATITLEGMSNTGKSHISKRLVEEYGFDHECIDDKIEAELEPVLQEAGFKGLEGMGRWMGHPYEARYREAQRTYLDLEKQITRDVISRTEASERSNNLVIDTTGSVVHTSQEICKDLGRISTVVYLQVSEEGMDEMYENFIKNPKPLVWGDVFSKEAHEGNDEALARCYPELLRYRSGLYAAMADVVLPRETLIDISGSDFLQRVQAGLS